MQAGGQASKQQRALRESMSTRANEATEPQMTLPWSLLTGFVPCHRAAFRSLTVFSILFERLQ
jgi:hypothetical protein